MPNTYTLYLIQNTLLVCSMLVSLPFIRVLVVDDNAIDILIITKLLERAQLFTHIDSVETVPAALTYLADCQSTNCYPEAILLDVEMPVLSGFDFLKEVFSKKLLGESPVKIILLTSSISPLDKKQAADYPIAGYLDKPLKLDSLRTVLQLP